MAEWSSVVAEWSSTPNSSSVSWAMRILVWIPDWPVMMLVSWNKTLISAQYPWVNGYLRGRFDILPTKVWFLKLNILFFFFFELCLGSTQNVGLRGRDQRESNQGSVRSCSLSPMRWATMKTSGCCRPVISNLSSKLSYLKLSQNNIHSKSLGFNSFKRNGES